MKSVKKRKIGIILIVILLVIISVLYIVILGTRERRKKQDLKETSQISYSNGTKSNVLIAYFTGADNMTQDDLDAVSSASVKVVGKEIVGNTEYAAMKMQELTHGDLFSIQTEKLYSQNYTLSTIQALGEQILNIKPDLVSHVDDFEQYDVILLGYPAWWMDVPIAIEEFLEEYDFSDKTVIPFTTHVSSGLGDTVEKIQKLIPEADVLSGISIQEEELNNNLEQSLSRQLAGYVVE